MPDLDSIQIAEGVGNVVVPQGTPPWITPELIEHTLRVWQPYYPDLLTSHDAVKILMNVSRLMGVLSRR